MLEDKTAYMGKLLETYVASSFINLDNKNIVPYKIYYDDSNRNSEKNVDFIVQRGVEKPIPIEVICGKKVEPPRRVDDEDSQTKKNYSFFGKFLLHRSPYDF